MRVKSLFIIDGIEYQDHPTRGSETPEQGHYTFSMGLYAAAKGNTKNMPLKTIALITPELSPSSHAIIQGFKQIISRRLGNVKYHIYNAENNLNNLAEIRQKLPSLSLDLIFTIGAQCSIYIIDHHKKNSLTTPVVFGGVKDPVKLGIAPSLEKPYKATSGVTLVYQGNRNKAMANLIPFISPNTENVLILCDPIQNGGTNQQDQYEVASVTKLNNINASVLNISHKDTVNIETILPRHLQKNDVLVTFNDSTIMPHMSRIIKLCNRYNTLAYSRDSEALYQGAGAVFGYSWKELGTESGRIGLKLIRNRTKMYPIKTIPARYQLMLNTKALAKQGVSSSPRLVMLLTHGYNPMISNMYVPPHREVAWRNVI